MLKNMNTWSKNLLYIMVIFAVPKLVIRHNFAELLFYLAIALVAVIMSLDLIGEEQSLVLFCLVC